MHLGETKASERLKRAVLSCLARRQTTRDLGGKLGTKAFTSAVIKAVAKL